MSNAAWTALYTALQLLLLAGAFLAGLTLGMARVYADLKSANLTSDVEVE